MIIKYLIYQNRALKERITDIKKLLSICPITIIIVDDIKMSSFNVS